MSETANSTVSQKALLDEWTEIQAAQATPSRFAPIYDRYYESIFRFVWRRCADEDLAGDITAQVFLKAMQKLGTYTFKGIPFSAWLFRIASNEVAQHYRQQQKARVVTIDDSNIQLVATEYGDEVGELEITLENMKSAMQELSEDEIILLELRFFEQNSFKEIGEILNITENNAKVKTYRLLEKLKKKMTKK